MVRAWGGAAEADDDVEAADGAAATDGDAALLVVLMLRA